MATTSNRLTDLYREALDSVTAIPALVLCIMVLAFNLLGDGLRNALDPKFRK